MGTGVFWGMLVATALGVFIIPGNYTLHRGARPGRGFQEGPGRAIAQRRALR